MNAPVLLSRPEVKRSRPSWAKWLLGVLILAGAKEGAMAEELGGIHKYKAKSIDGEEVDLAAYKGKVVLIVNVASRCGFTSQYKDLEALYRKFKDKGFVVLGFPSNDFGAQEPGTDAEIKKFCSTSYQVSFPIFTKAPVTGASIQPIYKYLVSDAKVGGTVMWNFEKFLIGRDGLPVERFRSAISPSGAKFQAAIEKLL